MPEGGERAVDCTEIGHFRDAPEFGRRYSVDTSYDCCHCVVDPNVDPSPTAHDRICSFKDLVALRRVDAKDEGLSAAYLNVATRARQTFAAPCKEGDPVSAAGKLYRDCASDPCRSAGHDGNGSRCLSRSRSAHALYFVRVHCSALHVGPYLLHIPFIQGLRLARVRWGSQDSL